jgi:AcrR family transcriptional regulator
VPGTRERLIAATAELFRRRGYHGTAMKDVITAAGATTGSLYHFFPGGKTQLAEAVITETGAAYQQLCELVADEAASVTDGIDRIFGGVADALEENDFIDVCPIGTVAGEVASSDERLRHAADGVFTAWTEAIASRLRAAGVRRPEAERLATTVIAALEGAIVVARCRRDADLLRDAGGHVRDLVADRLPRSAPGRRRRPAARTR